MITLKFKDQEVNVKTHPEDETLYCLNDIHKSSGGEKKNQPNHFKEYSNSRKFGSKIKSLSGRYGGSYADEKTVYKYAAWIDDTF
ncbi:KilA-N domain-containing protein [uncultured Endozoicomonas sp.]|uniref:KilA-N domain-containing protein n=1 Tax=uncultured Endozoicomonas sp. TaxID=432652 RepID=UPI00261BD228|nr:KilA-N domain-containing protein [uncultured Endozoicomonas sp.]